MKDYDRDEPNHFLREVGAERFEMVPVLVVSAWASTDSVMLTLRVDG